MVCAAGLHPAQTWSINLNAQRLSGDRKKGQRHANRKIKQRGMKVMTWSAATNSVRAGTIFIY